MEKHSEAISMKCNQQRQSPAHSNGCDWATSELGIAMTPPRAGVAPRAAGREGRCRRHGARSRANEALSTAPLRLSRR
eukprot:12453224-Alexandrium_andersonii.AAC.1